MSNFQSKKAIKDEDLHYIVALLVERKKALQDFSDAVKAKKQARKTIDSLTYQKIGEKFGYGEGAIQKLVSGENHVKAMEKLFPNLELR